MRGLFSAAVTLIMGLSMAPSSEAYPLPPSLSFRSLYDEVLHKLNARANTCSDFTANLGSTLRTAKAKDCLPAISFQFDSPTISKKTVFNQIKLLTPVTTKPAKPTCDHILELNILKKVMEQDGGVCEKMNQKGLSAEDQRAAIANLITIINDPATNLAFYTALAESKKTVLVDQFGKTPPVTVPTGNHDPFQVLSALEYLRATRSKSIAVAKALDAEIASNAAFKDADGVAPNGGVETLWETFLTFAEGHRRAFVAAGQKKVTKVGGTIDAQIAASDANAAACPAPGAAAPGTPPPPSPRLARRQAAQPPAGPRGRGARRAKGAAPSCPLPGAKPKQKVPRSSVTPKPAPANKRIASPARPVATRAPAKKTVKPRPASRPKRKPGQAAKPVKRTTPRRKPKQVPKRPNKPAGRPRRRRA